MTRDSCISNVCSGGEGEGGAGNHFVNMDFLGLSTHCATVPLTTHAAAAGLFLDSASQQRVWTVDGGILHIQHF